MVNKKTANKYSLILIIIAIVFWFLLAPLSYVKDSVLVDSGPITYLAAAFGKKHHVTGGIMLNFSFLNLLPLILMVVLAMTLLLANIKIDVLNNNRNKLVFLVIVVITVILLFLVKTFLKDNDFGAIGTLYDNAVKLGAGAFVIPVLLLGTAALQILKK